MAGSNKRKNRPAAAGRPTQRMCEIQVPTVIPITGGERSRKKVSERTEERGGDWVETEEGLKKYELVYDYAAGSIKKGKEVQRGRHSRPWPCACCDFGNAAPTFPVPPRCGLPPEPGLFFLLTPARNFSPRSTLKKREREATAPPQHEEPGQKAWEGNMELVSDLCLLLVIVHAPAVLALSTRKLRGSSPVRCGSWLRCGVRRPALARCHAVLLFQLWVRMAKHLQIVILATVHESVYALIKRDIEPGRFESTLAKKQNSSVNKPDKSMILNKKCS